MILRILAAYACLGFDIVYKFGIFYAGFVFAFFLCREFLRQQIAQAQFLQHTLEVLHVDCVAAIAVFMENPSHESIRYGGSGCCCLGGTVARTMAVIGMTFPPHTIVAIAGVMGMRADGRGTTPLRCGYLAGSGEII